MTHAELDQIAARAIFTTDLLGKGTTLQNYVALTASERDALLTLAREGLRAREALKVDTTVTSTAPLDEDTRQRLQDEQELMNRLRAGVLYGPSRTLRGAWCDACGFVGCHAEGCSNGTVRLEYDGPPTSGPDGVR